MDYDWNTFYRVHSNKIALTGGFSLDSTWKLGKICTDAHRPYQPHKYTLWQKGNFAACNTAHIYVYVYMQRTALSSDFDWFRVWLVRDSFNTFSPLKKKLFLTQNTLTEQTEGIEYKIKYSNNDDRIKWTSKHEIECERVRERKREIDREIQTIAMAVVEWKYRFEMGRGWDYILNYRLFASQVTTPRFYCGKWVCGCRLLALAHTLILSTMLRHSLSYMWGNSERV